MSVQSQQMIEWVWQQLDKEIRSVKRDVQLLSTRSERAETAGGVSSVTFVNLPTVNVGSGDILWCSNCRKIGEGGGAGTGQMVYYNPGTATWKRISDDANAAI